MNNKNEMNEKALLRDELLKDIAGGQIINRSQMEDYIRRMKAAGYSKDAVVGTITTLPEAGAFSTDPWGDVKELYRLASEFYDKA